MSSRRIEERQAREACAGGGMEPGHGPRWRLPACQTRSHTLRVMRAHAYRTASMKRQSLGVPSVKASAATVEPSARVVPDRVDRVGHVQATRLSVTSLKGPSSMSVLSSIERVLCHLRSVHHSAEQVYALCRTTLRQASRGRRPQSFEVGLGGFAQKDEISGG